MKPDSYLPFYGNDFFEATRGYDNAIVCAYLRALWHYWSHTHCAGLPDDDEYLRRVCQVELHQWARTKPIIFGEFFQMIDGKWNNERCVEEHQKCLKIYENKVGGAAKARGAKTSKSRSDINPDTNPKNTSDINVDINPDIKADINPDIGLHSESEPEPDIVSLPKGVVEPPPGFPKTVDDAIAQASMENISDVPWITTTWSKAMGRGGVDAKEIPIRNFRYWIKFEWGCEQNRRAEHKQHADNRTTGRQGAPDRNAGTFNAGKGHLYAGIKCK